MALNTFYKYSKGKGQFVLFSHVIVIFMVWLIALKYEDYRIELTKMKM